MYTLMDQEQVQPTKDHVLGITNRTKMNLMAILPGDFALTPPITTCIGYQMVNGSSVPNSVEILSVYNLRGPA